jgi:hypothetical protein
MRHLDLAAAAAGIVYWSEWVCLELMSSKYSRRRMFFYSTVSIHANDASFEWPATRVVYSYNTLRKRSVLQWKVWVLWIWTLLLWLWKLHEQL